MKSQSITELNNTRALRYATAIVSVICVWAALPMTEASAQACVPDCRTGYTCHQGECVSVCNPVCDDGEACNAAGECIAVAPTRSVMPETPRSVQLNDSLKPKIAVPATFVALGGFFMVAGGVAFATAEYDYFGYWTGGHYAGLGLMTMGAISVIVGRRHFAPLLDDHSEIRPKGALWCINTPRNPGVVLSMRQPHALSRGSQCIPGTT